MKKLLFIPILLILKFTFAYEIKGTLNISEQWQPIVYLASINTPGDLFVASPEFIINSGPIAHDGTFFLSGDDLPEDPRYYRVYLIQNSFSAVEFYNQPVRNFMHIVLGNQEIIEFGNNKKEDIFGSVSFPDSEKNKILHDFENDFYLKKIQLDEGTTKSKRDFLNLHLNKFIRDFTNSCTDPMLGLFALYHIDDKETDFLRNSDFYFNFQVQIMHDYPNSPYTYSYNELLDGLIGFRDLVCEMPQLANPWKNWVIGGEAIIIFLLIFLFFRKQKAGKNESNLAELLSDKEMKILQEMAAGKANKEIANELFIELSTVKTHINSIYKKLGAVKRQDAINTFNQLKNKQTQ